MTKVYSGVFADLLQEFVEFKRSMGYKYMKEENYLLEFSEFSTHFKVSEQFLTKEIVDAWCEKRPHESQRTGTEQRISCIRQFALYLISLGHNAYIPLHNQNKNNRKSKYTAYIYTHAEIESIFASSDKIYPHRRSTMHLVMPTLTRLLYSTGLRISEALNLQIKHIDLIEGVLLIKNTKFGKDRLIPLSETMLKTCKQYYAALHQHSMPDDYFFVGVAYEPCSHQNIYIRFREILFEAGIPHAGRGNGPRIHDLRHTFSCHTLKAAEERNVDLYATLPVLSTYMGHESITATSQYLRMTAEVYPNISNAVNALCAFVIPEVSS